MLVTRIVTLVDCVTFAGQDAVLVSQSAVTTLLVSAAWAGIAASKQAMIEALI